MGRSTVGPRLSVGQRVDAVTLETIDGRTVALPDPQRLVHLQFRRFAGCPICNLHLKSFAERGAELVAAGVHEIVLFHSSAEKLREFPDLLSFDTVADPTRTIYDAFGVGSSIRAELHYRPLVAGLQGLLRRRGPMKLNMGAGILGLPADLLIGADGVILDCYYGSHADDQWSFDEVLERARRAQAAAG